MTRFMRRGDHRVAAAAALTATLSTGLLVTAGSGGLAGARDVVRGSRPTAAPAPAASHAEPLVVLLSDHVVRAAPDAHAHRVATVAGRRPLTHVRTTLPLLARARARSGGAWVRVRLPGRPNGHAGWISAEGTRNSATVWHVVVDLSARTVSAYRRGRLMGRFRAVVGQRATPTPHGRFFVEETLPVSGLGGPYALAISARSTVYHEFAGGPGQVAVHGTTGLQGARGTAVSHGCVRLSPRAMRWLGARIGPGVPLTVR